MSQPNALFMRVRALGAATIGASLLTGLVACGTESKSNYAAADGSAASQGGSSTTWDAAATADASDSTSVAGSSGSMDSGPSYPELDAGSCLPGVPRCHGDFGYQQCEQDGTWGPPQSCAGYSSNGTSSYCVMTAASAGSEPWAACVDPACWYWITRGFVPGPTPAGICTSSTTIRQCNAGGTLSTETCAGVCTQVGTLDGRALGYCTPQCIEGARECIGGPLYRECAAGRWRDQPLSCEQGQVCNPVGEGSAPEIRCGGLCDTGTSRCLSDRTGIEVCTDLGTWEPGRACMLGWCRPAGPQAQCEAECYEGQFQCAYDGADSERNCGEQSRWNESTPCAEETTCRVSGGQALGCAACVGPNAAAGNGYGVADSRCEGNGVAVCGEGNTWLASQLCGEGEGCLELRQGASSIAYCQPQ